MIVQLYLWALFYLLLLGGGGYGAYRVVRWKLGTDQRRQHQLMGARNLKLLQAHDEEICRLCDHPTSPEKDLFDPKIGWHHGRCIKKLLNE